MIKAVIFDCFGVLITDGLELFIQQIEKTKPEARHQIFDIIRQLNTGAIERPESDRRISEYLGPLGKDWHQKITAGEVKNTELMAWIRELRQQYKTALLSNTGKDSLKRRFERRELEELFDEIVVSADIGIVKPDPEIYHLAARRLGVEPEECVFFDDRQHHVDGARKAGMQAFLFKNVRQAQSDLQTALTDAKH